VNLRISLEYDGTDFSGWAAQPGRRTVEQVVRTRPPTKDGVPIVGGLDLDDRVITNPMAIRPGDRVRIRSSGQGER